MSILKFQDFLIKYVFIDPYYNEYLIKNGEIRMSDEALKKDLYRLKEELVKKEREEISYLDKIEKLEDTIIRLEKLVSDDESKDSKSLILLDEKDREIRELKDKMGFLRKENINLQQELEKAQKKNQAPVIRLEEKKTPLDGLANELQSKINQQKVLISKLKSENEKYIEVKGVLSIKENKIKELSERINLLESVKMEPEPESIDNAMGIQKTLTQELQDKLNKTRVQLETMRQKLVKYEKPRENQEETTLNSKLSELEKQNERLKSLIETKDNEIQTFKVELENLKENKEAAIEKKAFPSLNSPVSQLTEELQSKLNKARTQISLLEKELKVAQQKAETPQNRAKFDLMEDIKIKDNKILKHQDQIKSLQTELTSKEQELNSLKSKLKSILDDKPKQTPSKLGMEEK